MKQVVILIISVALLTNCSKQSNFESGGEPNQSTIDIVNGTQGANQVNVDDGKKKYAPKICYIVGNPHSVGTVCEDPGNKCKAYECDASFAPTGDQKLTDSQIAIYANLNADILLKKGLIDQKDFDYFQELTSQALRLRNSLISSGK